MSVFTATQIVDCVIDPYANDVVAIVAVNKLGDQRPGPFGNPGPWFISHDTTMLILAIGCVAFLIAVTGYLVQWRRRDSQTGWTIAIGLIAICLIGFLVYSHFIMPQPDFRQHCQVVTFDLPSGNQHTTDIAFERSAIAHARQLAVSPSQSEVYIAAGRDLLGWRRMDHTKNIYEKTGQIYDLVVSSSGQRVYAIAGGDVLVFPNSLSTCRVPAENLVLIRRHAALLMPIGDKELQFFKDTNTLVDIRFDGNIWFTRPCRKTHFAASRR